MTEKKKEENPFPSIHTPEDLKDFFKTQETESFAAAFLNWAALRLVLKDLRDIVSEGWHIRYSRVEENSRLDQNDFPIGNTVYFLEYSSQKSSEDAVNRMIQALKHTFWAKWRPYRPSLQLRVLKIEPFNRCKKDLENSYLEYIEEFTDKATSQQRKKELRIRLKSVEKCLLFLKKELKECLENSSKMELDKLLKTRLRKILQERLEDIQDLLDDFYEKLEQNKIKLTTDQNRVSQQEQTNILQVEQKDVLQAEQKGTLQAEQIEVLYTGRESTLQTAQINTLRLDGAHTYKRR